VKNFQKNLKLYVLGALFIANLFIWSAVFAEERDGALTVAFLDVGQGDAILTMWTQCICFYLG